MIFADVESKSRLKVINREVNMVAPATPSYLKWSQTAITFDHSDHPTHIATPGRQALVVDPVVEGTTDQSPDGWWQRPEHTVCRNVERDGHSDVQAQCQ